MTVAALCFIAFLLVLIEIDLSNIHKCLSRIADELSKRKG